jgi:hypothetical protein
MKEIKGKKLICEDEKSIQKKMFPDNEVRLIEMKAEEKKTYSSITTNREFTIILR